MRDSDFIPVSVRVSKEQYEKYRKTYGKTFSEFVRSSLILVLSDGRESFEKIFFDKTLLR